MNPPGQPPTSHGEMMSMMGHHATMGMSPLQPHQQQTHHHQSPHMANAGIRCCAGCGVKILDRFLLHALDRYWHNGCLKCSCCQATLADIGSSCFTKAGMILCKTDYIRLFGTSGSCSACGQMIPASEFVMRAQNNVYHLKCFACVKCHNQLVPGDRYNLVNGNVLCEQDCMKMLKGTVSPAGVRKNGKMRLNSAIKVWTASSRPSFSWACYFRLYNFSPVAIL